jgi:GH15 family glucan-1,4-alpha-glucosidase
MKTLTDQIASARRELSMRRRVYPSWIERKRMTQTQADHEIACMEAIIATLEAASDQRAAFVREMRQYSRNWVDASDHERQAIEMVAAMMERRE